MKLYAMTIIKEIYTKRPEADKNLYHYTSAEGLYGIITSGKLWATNVHFLNDAKEVKHAIDILADVIDERIDTSNNKTNRFLENIKKILTNPIMHLYECNVFVSALSGNGNVLSQWRGYCPNGEGYSIGFDMASLEVALEHPFIDIAKCIYEPRQQIETMSALLDEIIDEYLEEYDPNGNINILWDKLWRNFLDRFFLLAALIKHDSFYEEEEWRIVYHDKQIKDYDRKDPIVFNRLRILYRPSGSLLIPYVSLPLESGGKTSVKLPEIIIGPNAYPELARASIESFRYSYMRNDSEGDNASGKAKFNVLEITESRIPLRNL